MTEPRCPFCPPDPARVFLRDDRAVAVWDAFPVSKGHALVIPLRHVADPFDATAAEHEALVRMVAAVRNTLDELHHPAGYNIGVNVGVAAGQTGPTCMCMSSHATKETCPTLGAACATSSRARAIILRLVSHSDDPPGDSVLATGGRRSPPSASDCPSRSGTVEDLAVAFALECVVWLLEEHLRDLLARGGRVRL